MFLRTFLNNFYMVLRSSNQPPTGPISGELGIKVIRDAKGNPKGSPSKRDVWLNELLQKSHTGTLADYDTYIDALEGKIDPPDDD